MPANHQKVQLRQRKIWWGLVPEPCDCVSWRNWKIQITESGASAPLFLLFVVNLDGIIILLFVGEDGAAMTETEKKKAATKFAADWKDKELRNRRVPAYRKSDRLCRAWWGSNNLVECPVDGIGGWRLYTTNRSLAARLLYPHRGLPVVDPVWECANNVLDEPVEFYSSELKRIWP